MKICPRCGIEKAYSDFPKDASKSSGFSSHCKVCNREKKKRWLKTEKGSATKKAARKRNSGSETAKARYKRSWSRKMATHPEKIRARCAVKDALKYGKLFRKPCEVCGDVQVEAHHDDYSKQLEVRFLCQKHHREFHENFFRNFQAQ